MSKPLIYITRKLPTYLIEPYTSIFRFKMWEKEETPVPRDVLLQEVSEADGLICMLSEKIDTELFNASAHLKIVANMAVGYDNIDEGEARKRGVVVTNTPDVLTNTTADLGFGLLMATARRMMEASDYLRADEWENWAPFMLAGTDIHRKKIGIVGLGRIGQAIAKRAKGFDMEVLYHNRSRNKEAEESVGAEYCSFEELIQHADFIVSVVPLSEETHHLFDTAAFRQMKKTAIFINISRGQTVDEEALYKALTTGEIASAGLDVFEEEPIRSNHPLVGLSNTVCLPHIGSASTETREKMIELCFDNIKAYFDEGVALTPIF